MLARDHALSGALVFTAVSPPLHVTGTALLAGAVFTAGAATAPDIDERGSTISRTLGFFTEAVSWVVHKISGGHRKGTHSIIGLIVFTAAAWLAVHHLTGLTGKVVLGVILGVILSAGVRALQIGGHHGDLIGLAGAAAAVYWQAGLALVPLCIALGVAAHIAGDELTHDGCPLAWPVSRQEFHLLPRRLQITTGRFAETWIVSTLLLTGLGYLLYRDTGIAGFLTHLHVTGQAAP
ncbi:MAG: metal-dependent hydrolase [Streptosporangiaceae bacterium]